ncbi:ComF family protein [Usitatibacter palustris]|uniref:ComF family protein n=1 Tax=Usitatibacter palustris TaxID=2732487 RepID=UPI001BB2B471|nr:ComF family protein [Usitatibacter palustris]
MDRLVKRFKFAGDLAVGAWLAARVVERVRAERRPDLLLPMPLAAARLRERGFNQAHELARIVGRALGIRFAAGATRIRATAPQSGLDRPARERNLRGAFRVAGGVGMQGRSIAIIDDVLTSGATASSLAVALKSAGAERVDAWVVARTPGPGAG